MPRHGQANEGRQLLGLAEIGVRGVHQGLAIERDDALVAVLVGAAVDGHGDVALAQQRTLVAAALGFGEAGVGLVEVGIAAQLARRHEVGDQEIERAVGLGLQDELGPGLGLERGAQHGGQRQRLAQRMTDGLRVGMPRQHGVDHRAQPDDAADHVRPHRAERQHQIVARLR